MWDPSTPSAAVIRFTDHAHRGCCSHLERLCFRVGGYDKEVVAGREKKKVYLCMTGSLFCTGEFNTILQINSNTKKKDTQKRKLRSPPPPAPIQWLKVGQGVISHPKQKALHSHSRLVPWLCHQLFLSCFKLRDSFLCL